VDTDQAEQIAMAHSGATLEQPFGPGIDVGNVVVAKLPTAVRRALADP
jgi:hypothetical protein